MNYLFSWSLILICCGLTQTAPRDFSNLMQEVPKTERLQFIRYHILLGYQLSKTGRKYSIPTLKLKLPEVPEEFSLALYKYAREHARAVQPTDFHLYGEIICFEDGTCVDIGDIGVHP